MAQIDDVRTALADLAARRDVPGGVAVCHNAVENFGGTLVECLPFEPDPNTYRHPYYYHTVLNRLFAKAGGISFKRHRNTRYVWVEAKNRTSL
jgi:hypothetical protein